MIFGRDECQVLKAKAFVFLSLTSLASHTHSLCKNSLRWNECCTPSHPQPFPPVQNQQGRLYVMVFTGTSKGHDSTQPKQLLSHALLLCNCDPKLLQHTRFKWMAHHQFIAVCTSLLTTHSLESGALKQETSKTCRAAALEDWSWKDLL